MVNKLKIKFIVDIALFIDILIVSISGFVLMFVYPAGQKSGMLGAKFLFDRFGWLQIHDIVTIIFVILIIIHLLLSWNWIKCMFKNKN